MKKLNISIKYLAGTLLLATVLVACNTSANKEKQAETTETASAIDTMKLQFNVAEVDTMSLLFPDSNDQRIISEADRNKLGETLALSVNDTLWNNSGIMVKMVAPDYTLISHYKGKTSDQNSWLMIWKENGRTKFDNKWYFLDESKKAEIYQILDSYK